VTAFDLRQYAAEHGYRLRNLHDGAPVPPTRRPPEHPPVAFRGSEDRHDAIIARHGYVDFGGWGPDRIGFCVLCRSARALTACLRRLEPAGVMLTQLGDTEAAGHAPRERIGDVLTALRTYRRRETLAGARFPEQEATRATRAG